MRHTLEGLMQKRHSLYNMHGQPGRRVLLSLSPEYGQENLVLLKTQDGSVGSVPNGQMEGNGVGPATAAGSVAAK